MIVSTDSHPPTPRWLRIAGRVALLCALPFGLVYCDRRTTSEGAALDTPEKVSAVVDEYLESLSRGGEEIQERIREAIESGTLSEDRGRELSAHVTGAASDLLIRYTLDHEVSEEDVRFASSRAITELSRRAEKRDALEEMRDALEEMQELIEEIGTTPKEERSQLSGRIEELNRRIRDAGRRSLGGMGSSVAFSSSRRPLYDVTWWPYVELKP